MNAFATARLMTAAIVLFAAVSAEQVAAQTADQQQVSVREGVTVKVTASERSRCLFGGVELRGRARHSQPGTRG